MGLSAKRSPSIILTSRFGKSFLFLVDSGAEISAIKTDLIGPRALSNNKITIKGVSGDPFDTLGSVIMSFKMQKNNSINFEFQVLPQEIDLLGYDGVIGTDFLEYYKANLDWLNGALFLNKKDGRQLAIALQKTNKIVSKILLPHSRNYIQIITDHTQDVYVEECQITKNIFLYGNVQTCKSRFLTLCIDNNSEEAFTLSNFEPKILSLNSVEVFEEEKPKSPPPINFRKIQAYNENSDRTNKIISELNVKKLNEELMNRIKGLRRIQRRISLGRR